MTAKPANQPQVDVIKLMHSARRDALRGALGNPKHAIGTRPWAREHILPIAERYLDIAIDSDINLDDPEASPISAATIDRLLNAIVTASERDDLPPLATGTPNAALVNGTREIIETPEELYGPVPPVLEIGEALLDELMIRGRLDHHRAVDLVERQFSPAWTYDNDRGNPAINPQVLDVFKAIRPYKAQWDRDRAGWRMPRNSGRWR